MLMILQYDLSSHDDRNVFICLQPGKPVATCRVCVLCQQLCVQSVIPDKTTRCDATGSMRPPGDTSGGLAAWRTGLRLQSPLICCKHGTADIKQQQNCLTLQELRLNKQTALLALNAKWNSGVTDGCSWCRRQSVDF